MKDTSLNILTSYYAYLTIDFAVSNWYFNLLYLNANVKKYIQTFTTFISSLYKTKEDRVNIK